MQLSLPWILSRKRLVAAVIADGLLFASLYYILYWWRFGFWPPVSPRLALLLAIWSLASYIVGRYVSGGRRVSARETWDFVGKQLISRGCSASDAWNHSPSIGLFNQNPVQSSFRSFLIPFLGSLAVLSPFIQLIISRLAAVRDRESAQPGPMLVLIRVLKS